MNTDDLLRIAEMVAVVAAMWGAIRSDIKNIHERVTRLENRIYND